MSNQPVPGGQADRREHEDRDDHHDQQEARAAARVQAREALGVRRASAAGRPRSRRSSCARRRGTRTRAAGRAGARAAAGSRGRSPVRTMPSTSQNRNEELSWSLIRLVRPTGTGRTARSRARARRRPCRPHRRSEISSRLLAVLPSSGGSWALAEISSALKPIASDPPSATTPRMIGRRSTRWRLSAESSGKVLTSISPSAASSGERCPRRAARRSACAPRPPSRRRRASSRPRAPPGRRRARRAGRSAGRRRVGRPPRQLRTARCRRRAAIVAAPADGVAARRRRAGRSRRSAASREDIAYCGDRSARLQAALGDAALEALDAAAGVHQLLAAGVERVAVRADLDVELVAGSSAW